MDPLRPTDAPGAKVMPPTPELFPGGSWERPWTADEDGKRLEGRLPNSVTPGKKVLLFRRPRGVIGVITPWNWPYTMPAELLLAVGEEPLEVEVEDRERGEGLDPGRVVAHHAGQGPPEGSKRCRSSC